MLYIALKNSLINNEENAKKITTVSVVLYLINYINFIISFDFPD